MESSTVPPLAVIVGPTGSGKSSLALRISHEFQGEIVSCDSVQIYRYFNIGSAKLPPDQWQGIPHHLIDVADPEELVTAGAYGRIARQIVHEIAGRGRLPVIAGGTGFYLRALLEGLSPSPGRDEELRTRLLSRERRRAGSLHRILSRLDQPAARAIHRNDINRTMRALELRLLRALPRTTLDPPQPLTGFQVIKIGLDPPRDLLNSRLDLRLQLMFGSGLIEETRSILARGISRSAKPFESLGYREALQFIDGVLTGDEALAAAQLHTRQYAKRQRTWFRRDAEIRWFACFGDALAQQEIILRYLREKTAVSDCGTALPAIEHG